MKKCKICGKTEEETTFKTGNNSTCRDCINARNRESAKLKKEGKLPNGKLTPPEGFKYCTKCERLLSFDNFYIVKKDGKNSLYSRCKECEREIVKNHPNREQYKNQSNLNRETKRKEDSNYQEYINEINKKYHNTNRGIINHMLLTAKKRAENNGLIFNIDETDIILPELCPILKVPFVKGTKGNYNYTYSLDRIDNSKGYIKGNVKVISQLANTMKNCASKEELIAFSENIKEYIE